MDNFYDDTDGGENGAYANTTLEDSNARILNDVQHPATSSQQDGYNGSYNWGFDANNPIGPPSYSQPSVPLIPQIHLQIQSAAPTVSFPPLRYRPDLLRIVTPLFHSFNQIQLTDVFTTQMRTTLVLLDTLNL